MFPAILHVLRALHEAQGDVVGVAGHGPVLDILDLTLTDDRNLHLDTFSAGRAEAKRQGGRCVAW